MTTLVVIGPRPDPAADAAIARLAVEHGAAVQWFPDVESALAERPALAAANAVVITPGVERPEAVARSVRAENRLVHLVIVVPADAVEDVHRALSRGAGGPSWHVVPVGGRVESAVSGALRSTRQRRQFRTTLDRINLELSATAAHGGAEYRKLVISDRHLASILMHAPDAVFSIDGVGRIVSWNPAASRLFGRSASEILREPFTVLVPGAPHALEVPYRRALEGHAASADVTWRTADGRDIALSVSFGPVVDAEGRPLAVSVIARDITERQAAERERQRLLDQAEAARAEAERSREQAEAANRAKDEFLAVLSHELRTPLTAMLGWVRLIRGGGVDRALLEHALAVVERNTVLQVQLINELLDVSRIVTGKLIVEAVPLDLATAVRAAVESVQEAAQRKRIDLRLAVTGPVPVRGDAMRLQQVVGNLFTNAIKFTPEGGRISVTLSAHDGTARLNVSDTGIGIASDVLPHVFDRFRQADTGTTRSYGGLGLGLAIARHLVEVHGGSITAESDGPSKGATFTVTLPVEPLAEARERDAPGDVSADSAGDRPLRGLRVLVVEDDADSRELVTTILAVSGATTRAAASAMEALAVWDTFVPHVLVSDIRMPGMDGYELIRTLRARTPGRALTAVALTAFAALEDERRAREAGFDMHVPKPVDPDTLVRRLTSVTTQT